MTTTAPEDLVRNVISEMRQAADNGDPSAIADLSQQSGSRAAAPSATPARQPDKVHTIPEQFVIRPNGERYVKRKMGIHDDVAVLRHARTKNHNVLLLGEPGTGKTALIEAAFAVGEEGPLYTLPGTGDTVVADFVGNWSQDPVTGLWNWIKGPLQKACEDGCGFYIDEAPLIDPKVMAIVYGLIDGRDQLIITDNPRLDPITPAPGFYVVASGNPNASGAHMDWPLLSRFPLQPVVTTDMKLARDLGVDPKLITATNNIQQKRNSNNVSWVPQMRELLDFRDAVAEYGQDFAIRALIARAPEQDRGIVKDLVGRQFANAFSPLSVD